MYFPYLRGKQFELLALREIGSHINSGLVSPILEPVKNSIDSLERALDSLIANRINFNLVINPIHGDFKSNSSELLNFINRKLEGYDNFQLAIIVHQFIDLDVITNLLERLSFDRPISLIHKARLNDIDALLNWVGDYEIKYNFFGENFPVRRYRGIITADTKVLLEDRFVPQAKNADYLSVPDQFFSDDHLYFEEDGFIGFGDYLTIGDDYSESGFLPFAVAIHLTYERNNAQIWIQHFVSDSNSDSTDPGGKFGEALEKLIEFINDKGINTEAAEEFRQLHKAERYPGLGSIKKLSIKHHLQLVHDILNA
jgi:hypothetical protein